MSNLCKRMAKRKKVCARKRRQEMHKRCSKQYTSFNIFTDDGRNITVTSEKPMTLVEAQYHYHALSISGNE